MALSTTFPVDAGWRTLFKDLGIVPADVFRRAGLPEDLFSRLPASLSPERWFRLWEALEAEVDDPLFPIRLVEVMSAEALSPPLFAALCSPNLVVACQRLRDYKRLVAPVALSLTSDRQGFSVGFEWLHTAVTPPPSMVAFEFVFFTKLARMATREHVIPLRVTSVRPPRGIAAFTEYLGVAISAGKANRIRFSAADAERPFLTANEAMWDVFEPTLRRRLGALEDSATIAERVKAALLELLPSGQTSMDAVTQRLAMSKRTLQRRLQGEGTNYGSLLNETREDLARHYLGKTSFTSSEIAFLLGFEEPSSFFRAFREWTGSTPEAMRSGASLRA